MFFIAFGERIAVGPQQYDVPVLEGEDGEAIRIGTLTRAPSTDVYRTRQWALVLNKKALTALGFPGAYQQRYEPMGLTLDDAKERATEVLRKRLAETQYRYPPEPTAMSRRYLRLVKASQ